MLPLPEIGQSHSEPGQGPDEARRHCSLSETVRKLQPLSSHPYLCPRSSFQLTTSLCFSVPLPCHHWHSWLCCYLAFSIFLCSTFKAISKWGKLNPNTVFQKHLYLSGWPNINTGSGLYLNVTASIATPLPGLCSKSLELTYAPDAINTK